MALTSLLDSIYYKSQTINALTATRATPIAGLHDLRVLPVHGAMSIEVPPTGIPFISLDAAFADDVEESELHGSIEVAEAEEAGDPPEVEVETTFDVIDVARTSELVSQEPHVLAERCVFDDSWNLVVVARVENAVNGVRFSVLLVIEFPKDFSRTLVEEVLSPFGEVDDAVEVYPFVGL